MLHGIVDSLGLFLYTSDTIINCKDCAGKLNGTACRGWTWVVLHHGARRKQKRMENLINKTENILRYDERSKIKADGREL